MPSRAEIRRSSAWPSKAQAIMFAESVVVFNRARFSRLSETWIINLKFCDNPAVALKPNSRPMMKSSPDGVNPDPRPMRYPIPRRTASLSPLRNPSARWCNSTSTSFNAASLSPRNCIPAQREINGFHPLWIPSANIVRATSLRCDLAADNPDSLMGWRSAFQVGTSAVKTVTSKSPNWMPSRVRLTLLSGDRYENANGIMRCSLSR